MKTFVFITLIAAALAAPVQNAPSTSCSQTQTQLEQGIQKNLDIQAQELTGVQSLQRMIQAGAEKTSAFQSEKECVLDIQQQGITVRASNQKLAATINSPATAGLAKVAMAQVTEMTQVQGLTGGAGDAATIATVVQEVVDGTKQNQANLAAAKSQSCAK